MARSSVALTGMVMSRNFTQVRATAPASRHTLAKVLSVGHRKCRSFSLARHDFAGLHTKERIVLRCVWHCVKLTEPTIPLTLLVRPGLGSCFCSSLLHRPPRGGLVPKSHLLERFFSFATGHWAELLDHSQVCADQAAIASRRRRRCDRGDDPQRRVNRAEALAHW